MPKNHQATEAGITVTVQLGRKRTWPLYEWRQAIRTGLNWYWAQWGWVKIEIQFGEKSSGRRIEFFFGGGEATAWFNDLCQYSIPHSASEVVYVTRDMNFSPNYVAGQLLRFAWNRDVKVLVVPVIKARDSYDIKGNVVVLFAERGYLNLSAGDPPIIMSE